MRATGIYHPLFATHPRLGLETSMTDLIEIRKPTGDPAQWVPGQGMEGDAYELVYRGPARVQPNIDWRARDRNHAGELTATLAVRIQTPFGKNEIGQVLDGDGEVVSYGDDPLISKDYMVNVISSSAPDAEPLTEYTFVVRNAVQASEKWLRTFLADTGTRAVE